MIDLGPGAPTVQTMYDSWRNIERTLRKVGYCVGCNRIVWSFDDGANDPRGPLGEAALSTLEMDTAEGVVDVVCCSECTNDHYRYERAVARATLMLNRPIAHHIMGMAVKK